VLIYFPKKRKGLSFTITFNTNNPAKKQEVVEEYIPEIILGIVISGGIGLVFFLLNKKGNEQQENLLDQIAQTVEGITNRLMEMSKEKPGFVSASEAEISPSIKIDEEYKLMAKKCLELLQDERWTWRSDVILIRKTGMTEQQLDYFVQTTQGVVRSKIPDINGNRLFSLRSKLEK